MICDEAKLRSTVGTGAKITNAAASRIAGSSSSRAAHSVLATRRATWTGFDVVGKEPLGGKLGDAHLGHDRVRTAIEWEARLSSVIAQSQ
jgi:hypothetical protein